MKVRSRGKRVVGVCIEPRKLFSSCGPFGDKRRRGCLILAVANRGQFHPAGTQQPPGVMASRRGDHRGRRPDHDDTGIARELVRASSASCLHRRGSTRGNPWESTAISKLPLERPAAPPGRSWSLNAETTGTRGRARVVKEPRMGVRQSYQCWPSVTARCLPVAAHARRSRRADLDFTPPCAGRRTMCDLA
jgi:hypothetical protein